MPITISPEGWEKWHSTIDELAKKYQFPANSFDTLNGYLALFDGEGSTFRCESGSWKFVIDVIRNQDIIIDIATITLISKAEDTAKERTGWVIAPQCPIHLRDDTAGQADSTKKQNIKLMWYRITEGGRYTAYCCKPDCEGPFKAGPWRVFDTARQGIVIKVLEREVVQLWNRINGAHPLPEEGEHLKARNLRLGRLERELSEINQAYFRARQEAEDLRARNKRQHQELGLLNRVHSRLVQSTAKEPHVNEEARRTQADVSRMRNYRDNLKRANDNLRNTTKDLNSTIFQLQDSNDSMKQQRDALELERKEAERQKNKVEREYDELQKSYAKLQAELILVRDDNETLRWGGQMILKENDTLRKRNENIIQSNQTLEMDVEKIRESLESMEMKMRSDYGQKQASEKGRKRRRVTEDLTD